MPVVLVSCGSIEQPNVLTVAWTGILSSEPPKTYVSVRPSRHSHALIKETGEFVINLPSSYLIRIVDFCGVKSGRDMQKFDVCTLTAAPSVKVGAPSVAECPVSLECRVSDVLPLGSHDMFIADIVGVTVDEKYIDENGKLHLEQASLAAYAHGEYFALGEALGHFGWSVRKKKKAPFPIAVVFSAVLLTLLFLFMMMNYAEIDRYNSEIAEMKATVTDLKAEADKLQGKLDKKDGAITGMQSYIEDELGMVKSDSLPKEYVSLLPEDVTTVIDRRGDEGGFGVLLSGLSEVIRNFLND